MLTTVCIPWFKGGPLSRQSIHADEYHEKQQCEESRQQVHLSSSTDSQLDELQPLPPLTTGVYLNGVELGEPLFTEEELRLAMTRTTISSWVEGRWRLSHMLDRTNQCLSESSAVFQKSMRFAVGRNTIDLSLLARALAGCGLLRNNGVNDWGGLKGFSSVRVLCKEKEWIYKKRDFLFPIRKCWESLGRERSANSNGLCSSSYLFIFFLWALLKVQGFYSPMESWEEL